MAEKLSTREVYGHTIAKIGEKNNQIIAIDADLASCTMSQYFRDAFPERFFNVGIAETNMAGIAAGFATCGKIPFIHTFAVFAAGRIFDQIRNSICYPKLNVKVVGTHAGLSVGEDGPTHQSVEDIALMRSLPNMTVVCPSDSWCTEKATEAITEVEGPCFLRLGRPAVDPVVRPEEAEFKIGKGIVLKDGDDLSIIATGLMVNEAIKASNLLSNDGISCRVIEIHTIKPIDSELIIKCAKETGAIVTTEEASIIGGLGSAVSEVVSSSYPVPVIRHGINDEFGHSGTVDALMKAYNMTAEDIVKKAKQALEIKKK